MEKNENNHSKSNLKQKKAQFLELNGSTGKTISSKFRAANIKVVWEQKRIRNLGLAFNCSKLGNPPNESKRKSDKRENKRKGREGQA